MEPRQAPRSDLPLYLLIGLSSINQFAFMGVRFCLTLYAVHISASEATVGALIALFGAVSIPVSAFLGRWLDSAGTRLPMLISCAGMVIGAAIFFASDSIPALFGIATVVGMFYNVYYIAQQLALGRIGGREQRVRNFSLAALGVSAASFCAPLVSGFVIDEVGYGVAFLLMVLAPLVPMVAIAAHRLPMVAPRPPSQRSSGSAFALLRERELRVIYIFSTISLGVWQTVLFLLPLYGVSVGLNAFHTGVLTGSFPIAAMLSRLMLPALMRRFTAWQVLVGSLLASVFGMAALPFLHSLVPLVLATAWLGAALGTCNPVSQALLFDVAPEGREGEVLGLWSLLASVMQAVTPLLFGAVSTALGMGPVFWTLSLGMLACTYTGRDRLLKGRRAGQHPG